MEPMGNDGSTSIVSVAALILDRCGYMPTMKLHRLAYYAQAESLRRYDRALFGEDFQAWMGGPVCVSLYLLHRGRFLIQPGELGEPPAVADEEREVIDSVCDALGGMSSNALAARIQNELPWRSARGGTPRNQSCKTVISKRSMLEYYRTTPVVDVSPR